MSGACPAITCKDQIPLISNLQRDNNKVCSLEESSDSIQPVVNKWKGMHYIIYKGAE